MRMLAQARMAIRVGLVGGFVLGGREALLSLPANVVVQPDQYLLSYVAVPILTWLVLGSVALVPVAVAVGALRPNWESARSLSVYAGTLTFVGVLSIVLPAVTALMQRLGSVDMRIGPETQAALWVPAFAVMGLVSITIGVLIAWCGTLAERPLLLASRLVLILALLLALPIGRFLLTDWKWGLRPVQAKAVAQTGDPNVLLISIDTLRADHLSSYGDTHSLTPNLDRFADQGVCFLNTITTSPWTLPAMASLFTAQYPSHHGAGAITNGRAPLGRSTLAPGVWTLTKSLHERGYRTAAIVTNPYLALRYGLGEAFDSYENITVESEAFLSFGNVTPVKLLKWLLPASVIGDRAETVSDRAVTWLTHGRNKQPFFLWLHYIDPHPPYSVTTAHKSMRGDLSFGSPDHGADDILTTSPDVARLRSGEIRLNAEQKEAVRGLYRAEVRRVDHAVGRVLEALKRVQLYQNAVVIVVGDHGEEFWEHGGVEHGRTVYDEVVRVPLLMRWPGHLPAGTHVNALVRIVDVAPTLLELLQTPMPPARDGRSLLPVLNGAESAERVAFIENMLFAEERVGLRTLDRKYVRWEDGREELYDLVADPTERRDLAGADVMVQPLRRMLAEAQVSKIPALAQVLPPQVQGGTTEALRALGYVQ